MTRIYLMVSILLFTSAEVFPADSSASISQSLRALLAHPIEGHVKWDSLLHAHRYSDKNLEELVKRIIGHLVLEAKEFERAVESLTPKEREELAFDSLDSRIDRIDLLSVELKNHLERRWDENFGASFTYDRSTLWSLAKFRLKRLLHSKEKLESNYALFRESGIDSRNFILTCAVGIPSSDLPIQKKMEVAKMGFALISTAGVSTFTATCGSEHLLIHVRSEQSTEMLSKPTSFQPSHSHELNILGTVALTDSIDSKTLWLTSLFLRWKYGYHQVAKEEVYLKNRIQELLPAIDLFAPFSDIPDANHFQFSFHSDEGTELRFSKLVHPSNAELATRVNLSILLPPTHVKTTLDDLKKGAIFSEKEMSQIFKMRRENKLNNLAVMDVACFSSRYLGDWMQAYRDSVDFVPLDTPILWVSEKGHAGESSLDILSIMDILLSAFDSAAKETSIERIEQSLGHKTFLNKVLQFLIAPLEFLGIFIEPSESFFPTSNLESPYDAYLSPMKNSVVLEVRQNDQLKIYPPLLARDR